jgi:hypothetical protein
VIETRSQGGRLAEIAAQFHYHYAAVHGGYLLQQGEGMVTAAIVNKHQLERLLRGLHYRLQAVVEFSNVLLFVVERYNN